MKATPSFYNSPHFKSFWENGNGKELIEWSQANCSLDNFETFSHLFYSIDRISDQVVSETYFKLPFHEANELILKYSKSPIKDDDIDIPDSLKKFFLEMQSVPNWFDLELANEGARFCMRTGTNALIVLRDYSLMGGYDFSYLNKPLVLTGALKKGAVKRLKDTLEFWVSVTRENALDINSEAYQLIIRTRLMHSYARLSIKKKTSNWNLEKWGEPINTWDMIATYLGFSLVFMHGLYKFGIQIKPQEEKGVFHLWKYIGYLLGIPAEYLPNNKKEAVENFYLWTTTQNKSDEDSIQLAKALLDENLTNTIYPFMFQRKMLLKLHQSVNWYLLDKHVLNRLKIPQSKSTQFFPFLIKWINNTIETIFNTNDEKTYKRLVQFGDKNQRKILNDYLTHSPKDFKH